MNHIYYMIYGFYRSSSCITCEVMQLLHMGKLFWLTDLDVPSDISLSLISSAPGGGCGEDFYISQP